MENDISVYKQTNKYGNVYILNQAISIEMPEKFELEFDKYNNKIIVVDNEDFTIRLSYLYNAFTDLADSLHLAYSGPQPVTPTRIKVKHYSKPKDGQV